ncbi:unnamed protein product [Ectocarpus sp. 12 AP-2014]
MHARTTRHRRYCCCLCTRLYLTEHLQIYCTSGAGAGAGAAAHVCTHRSCVRINRCV